MPKNKSGNTLVSEQVCIGQKSEQDVQSVVRLIDQSSDRQLDFVSWQDEHLSK